MKYFPTLILFLAVLGAIHTQAEEVLPPTRVMPGVTIAVVRAPGGVPVGFAGP